MILSSLFLLVDALGGDFATLDGGDESISFDEPLDHRVLLFVGRIDLRVNHLIAWESQLEIRLER